MLKEVGALVTSLRACAKLKDLHGGSRIHAEILHRGLFKDNIYVGNTLIHMYAKCGEFAKAWQVLTELLIRDAVSWNALIAGYMEHGHAQEALDCFRKMQSENCSPNGVTFACILKACGSLHAAEQGESIHHQIIKEGLLYGNTLIGNALLDMYSKCSAPMKAQALFDELLVRDVISWNTLIAGYIQQGHAKEALHSFESMRFEGLSPNAVTFTCTLKACGSLREFEKGKEIRELVAQTGLLDEDIVLCTALLDMYAICGIFPDAQRLFNELPARDIVLWNALMTRYTQQGHSQETLHCYEQMQSEGFLPDPVTFTCILKACGCIGATGKGVEAHSKLLIAGLPGKDVVVGNALLDMYAKFGELERAQQVFDNLPYRIVASWNTLVAGCTQFGHYNKAFFYFKQMRFEGISPDALTFACIFQACGSIGTVEKGEKMHAEVVREGLLDGNTVLGNALVDMYAKSGALIKASQIFDDILNPDVVSWNVLISGYTQLGHGEAMLDLFEEMQCQGLSPDVITLTCVLKACGIVGEFERGIDIRAQIGEELLANDIVLNTALLGMYASCGAVTRVQEVFNKFPVHDVVSWNALIAAYIQHGYSEKALNCFHQMQSRGLFPDAVTFTCMVDLFGRAGELDKAMEVIQKMLTFDNLVIWFALLNACQMWGNTELGEAAFEHVVQLNDKSAVAYAYVCMRNIYSAMGLQENADTIEKMRLRGDIWKKPARSWCADFSGTIHSFCVGDESHPDSNILYAKIDNILSKISQEGYCPSLLLLCENVINAKTEIHAY